MLSPVGREKQNCSLPRAHFLTQESGSRLPIRQRRPFDNICVFQINRIVNVGLNARIRCVLRLGLFSSAGPTSSPSSPFLFCPYPYPRAFTPPLPPCVNVVRGPRPSLLECLSKCSILPLAGPTLKFRGTGGGSGRARCFHTKDRARPPQQQNDGAGKETKINQI